jgi:hypothetical protein
VAVSGVAKKGICEPYGGFALSFVNKALCAWFAVSINITLGSSPDGWFKRDERTMDAGGVKTRL